MRINILESQQTVEKGKQRKRRKEEKKNEEEEENEEEEGSARICAAAFCGKSALFSGSPSQLSRDDNRCGILDIQRVVYGVSIMLSFINQWLINIVTLPRYILHLLALTSIWKRKSCAATTCALRHV